MKETKVELKRLELDFLEKSLVHAWRDEINLCSKYAINVQDREANWHEVLGRMNLRQSVRQNVTYKPVERRGIGRPTKIPIWSE